MIRIPLALSRTVSSIIAGAPVKTSFPISTVLHHASIINSGHDNSPTPNPNPDPSAKFIGDNIPASLLPNLGNLNNQQLDYKAASSVTINVGMITAHYPHMSPSGGVSGHVSWTRIGNPRFSQMRLTAQLYAWSTFMYWAAGNADTRVVPPAKKGQTPSANSRANCKTKAETG